MRTTKISFARKPMEFTYTASGTTKSTRDSSSQRARLVIKASLLFQISLALRKRRPNRSNHALTGKKREYSKKDSRKYRNDL